MLDPDLWPEPDDEPWHGTVTGYGYRKCRGPLCRAAWNANQRANQRRRAAETTWDQLPHGTVNGYNNYMCRCVPCTAAATAACAKRRAAQRARGEKRKS